MAVQCPTQDLVNPNHTLHSTAIGSQTFLCSLEGNFNFSPIHFQDSFPRFNSIMWFGIILEGVIVGYMNDEGRSNTWLEYFLLVQACCIFVLYILFPIIQFVQKKSAIISPFLLLPIHAFQWAVIFFGMALVFKPSDYRFTAPTFFEVAFYTVGFYSITVPLSTLWAIRIYAAIYQVSY